MGRSGLNRIGRLPYSRTSQNLQGTEVLCDSLRGKRSRWSFLSSRTLRIPLFMEHSQETRLIMSLLENLLDGSHLEFCWPVCLYAGLELRSLQRENTVLCEARRVHPSGQVLVHCVLRWTLFLISRVFPSWFLVHPQPREKEGPPPLIIIEELVVGQNKAMHGPHLA